MKGSARGRMWLRIAAFVLVLGVVWFAVQSVLVTKYQWNDCLDMRYRDYAAELAGSVDVLMIGSSQLQSGLCPMVMYNETGITAMNMSGALLHHTLAIEQLKTLLSLNRAPKYVVFSPTSLISYRDATDSEMLALYYHFIDCQPTVGRKFQVYQAMQKEVGGSVDALPFAAPLIGWHSRWREISPEDFRSKSWFASEYKGFLKGQQMRPESMNITEFVDNEEDSEFTSFTPQSEEGWDTFLQLCKDNEITPVAVLLPRFDGVFTEEKLSAIVDWLDERDILTLNYMEEDALAAMNWDWRRHFADRIHLNLNGSLHLGADLAWQLSELAEVPDHRGEPGFEKWDADLERFFDACGENIRETLGSDYVPWYMAQPEDF